MVVKGGVKHSVAVPVSVPAGMDWSLVKRETTVEPPREPDAVSQIDATRAPIAKKRATPVADAPAGVAAGEATRGDDADGEAEDDADEAPTPASAPGRVALTSIDVSEESVERVMTTASYRRALRIATSLAGGLAVQAQDRAAVVALGARLELGRRTLVGADAALWLVDGDDVQGRLLVSIARRGVTRWLELGAGVGVHLGAGVGPAASLSLRLPLPPRPELAGFLRYDGALRRQPDDTRAGQHTLTLGLEWGF